MSERFIINGKKELKGEIQVRGAKNAAGALLAATLLTDKECILDNLPKVSDILNLLDILKKLGKEIEWLEERKVRIRGGDIAPAKLDFEKISKSRVSVLLMGALLPRIKEFKFSRPGGDRIGLRPITTHLQAFKELGAEISEEGDFYYFRFKEKLRGKEIILPEFSVTATENLIMASTLATGETIIKGAASEPQVQDLVKMLLEMGAEIEGIGTHTLKIKGVKILEGTEHKIIPDPLEAGTFIIVGAATGGKIRVRNIIPEHLDLFLAKLQEIGVELKGDENSIEVSGSLNLKPARVQALPYPGFPTDLLPLIIPLLTQAEGKSLIHDPLYENRLNFVHQLRKMGADIEIVD
ncbi:UDP-N-acetylglucosamine 1-carboxyvinyltransferase, partial [Candidatus Kuenenbacteria bacterium CG22_combo_CG10-13_8_21_14_all_39_9]